MSGKAGLPEFSFLDDDSFVMFDDSVAHFLRRHASPEQVKGWRGRGVVDRSAWTAAGTAGFLCPSIPEAYGGAGGDFRHDAILTYQLGLAGCEGWGLPLHNGIVAPYLLHYGTEAQKRAWLPRLATGEVIGAIAMTEPHAGSDLQAIRCYAQREGDGYRLAGSKTFITNGQLADLIIVVAKTESAATGKRDISLFLVDAASPGFRRGKKLEKLGLDAGDTSELFFDDVYLSEESLLGGVEGKGFGQLRAQLPQERLIIALESTAIMERAISATITYVKERKAFGKTLIEFQNTQFKLAEAKTNAVIAKIFVDRCINLLLSGKLDDAMASMAKYWCSETACDVVNECLQLHGGYGYMAEYPIADMYRDVRVKPIYGGTTEIMKMLIARSI